MKNLPPCYQDEMLTKSQIRDELRRICNTAELIALLCLPKN